MAQIRQLLDLPQLAVVLVEDNQHRVAPKMALLVVRAAAAQQQGMVLYTPAVPEHPDKETLAAMAPIKRFLHILRVVAEGLVQLELREAASAETAASVLHHQ
jgi:hypothetical protein